MGNDNQGIKSKEKLILDTLEKYVESYIKPYKEEIPRGWSKLQGDISLKIVRDFINRDLVNTDLEVSECNSFIEGYSTEFDLLIVKKESKPKPHSNIYNPNDVKTIIEVKTSGIYASKENIKDFIINMKTKALNVKNKYSYINYVYLTLKERASISTRTGNSTAMDYFAETKNNFSPFETFCLSDLKPDSFRSNHSDGKWDNFIKAIQ